MQGSISGRFAAVAFLVLVANIAITVLNPGGLRGAIGPALTIAVMVLSGAAVLASGFEGRGDRLARLVIGAGILSYATGDVFFYWVQGALFPSFPTPADVFWLALYPPIAVGLVLLLRPRTGSMGPSFWLDGVIAGLTVILVAAELAATTILSGTTVGPGRVAAMLVLPSIDVVFLALFVALVALCARRIGLGLLLVMGGVLVLFVSDGINLYQTSHDTYAVGALLDTGWPTAIFLIAAGIRKRVTVSLDAETRPVWSLFGIPGAAFVIASILLMDESLSPGEPFIPALAFVVLLLVLARLFLGVRENSRRSIELNRTDERYRLILETTHEGVWVVDSEQKTTFINPRLAEMLGYEREAMLGKAFWDFLDEEGRAFVAKNLGRQRPGETGQMELRYKHKDGSDVWTIITTSVLPDDQGDYAGALAMVTDISERKAFEQALQDREKQLAEAQRIAHLGSWQWDVASGRAWWSEELRRIFGLPIDLDASYDAILECVHPDDRVAAQMTAQASIENVEPYKCEYRILRPDGAVRMIDSRADLVMGPDGEVEEMIGTVQDVTELKLAEQKLAQQAMQQAAVAELGRKALGTDDVSRLMDAAVDLIKEVLRADYARLAELEPDGQSLVVRAGVGQEGGMDQGTVIPLGEVSQPGYTLTIGEPLIVDDLRADPRLSDSMLTEKYEVTSGISVIVEERGSPFGVLSAYSINPREFNKDDANFLEAVANVLAAAIARDHTVQVEAELEQAQRLESVGQLAGGIAHDFNNLLSVILNHADFAIEQLGDDSPVSSEIENIRLAAERAADLTRQLLVFSRREPVKREVLAINALVRETETLLRRTLGEDIVVRSKLAPDVSPASVGAGQIEQVLVNLALNARDAMPAGGMLQIETSNAEFSVESVHGAWAVAPGRYTCLTVADTGCGMTEEIATRAFEPFFTTKPSGQGTGLGLATVYGIAKQAGGYVDIYTETGHGTAVKVYFPATTDRLAPERSNEPSDRGALRGKGETVLLVEDEDAVRTVAERILKTGDYDVISAGDGEAALRLFEANSIDLLLTDVVMPGMSGKELAERIAALRPGIKTLYMSGYTGDVMSRNGILDEGVTLVEKPFNAKTLLESIQAMLADGGVSPDEAAKDGHGKVGAHVR